MYMPCRHESSDYLVPYSFEVNKGPDTYPLTGRKSSALGTLSVVSEALKMVSIDSFVATKDDKGGARTMLALATTDCNSVMSILR